LLSLNTFGIPFFLSFGRFERLPGELEQLGPTQASKANISPAKKLTEEILIILS